MSLYDPETMREAQEGFREFSRRMEDLIDEPVDPSRSIIRFLKSIPTDDKTKKRELALFFQRDEGQRYSAAERKQAYDELLGVQRNRETIG